MGVSTLRSGRDAQWRCLSKSFDSVASLQAFRGSSSKCGTEATLYSCKQLVDDNGGCKSNFPTDPTLLIAISLPIDLLRYLWPVNVAPDCQVGFLCQS